MNTHSQTQLHQRVFDLQSGQSTKPACSVCGQQPLPQQAAEVLARIWAEDAPATRSARVQRLVPALAWLRDGIDLEAAPQGGVECSWRCKPSRTKPIIEVMA